MTADRVDADSGDDDLPPDDIDQVPHRRLRSALEFAVAVAGEATRRHLTVPSGLKDLIHRDRLSVPELGRARRAVVGTPKFRDGVGAAATAEVVDDIGRLWLSRPPGWVERILLLIELDEERERRNEVEQALRREQKRRESAERKRSQVETKAGSYDDRVEKLTERLASIRAELDDALAAHGALREEVSQRAIAERHALDRQRAAERQRDDATAALGDAEQRVRDAEAARDRLLAERADTNGGLTGHAIADLRRVSEQLTRLAADVRTAVSPPAERRAPVAVPGSVHGDLRATAEFLMRVEARVIVDGYNVAKLMWPESELEHQRVHLLDTVDNLARRYGTEVVVVFDGADVVGASADRRRLSRVVYSPAGVIADDVIRDEVKATPTARPVVVVTDDREIQRDVSRVGANVLSSGAFAILARS